MPKVHIIVIKCNEGGSMFHIRGSEQLTTCHPDSEFTHTYKHKSIIHRTLQR